MHKSTHKLRLLVFSRAFDSSDIGGVVSFVSSLINGYSDEILAEAFHIGRKNEKNTLINNALIMFKSIILLLKKTMNKEFDIVHINPSLKMRALIRDGIYLLLLKMLSSKPVIIFFHGWNTDTEKTIDQSFLLKRLFKYVYGHSSTTTLVLAASFKESLISWGFTSNKVMVVSTMFDGRGIERKERYLRFDEKINILFLSRLVKEKGVFELLQAFYELSQNSEQYRLTIAGDGEERDRLQRTIVDLGLSDTVHLCGYVSGNEKKTVFQQAHIFVLPSHSEGCPVSLLEAMAFGIPIVTTAVGGIVDLIEDTVNGCVINEVSVEQIKQAILYLAVPHRFTRISRINSLLAWSQYESKIVVKKIEKIYFQALCY